MTLNIELNSKEMQAFHEMVKAISVKDKESVKLRMKLMESMLDCTLHQKPDDINTTDE